MHAVVVMPDHVHLVVTPLRGTLGATFGLAEIIGGIKRWSARSVNNALGRRGSVWQEEYFDRMLRSDEDVRRKAECVCLNPVRRGLVGNIGDYPWLWREWVEGLADSR